MRYTRLASIVLSVLASAWPPLTGQQISVPAKWRTLTVPELLQQPEVSDQPFLVRDRLAMALVPEYAAQSWPDRRRVLLEAEKSIADSKRRPPLAPYIWTPRGKYSDSWVDDGRQYTAFRFPDGITLSVSVGEWDKYLDVWVMLDNRSKRGTRLFIGPERVELATNSPRFGKLERIESETIASKFVRGARWRAALIGAAGGMATQTETARVDGDYDGTVTANGRSGRSTGTYSGQATITRPDYEARARSQANARAVQTAAAERAAAVRRTALKRNTIFPDQAESGFVYFKRPPDDKQPAILRVIVGAASFEFFIDLASTREGRQ